MLRMVSSSIKDQSAFVCKRVVDSKDKGLHRQTPVERDSRQCNRNERHERNLHFLTTQSLLQPHTCPSKSHMRWEPTLAVEVFDVAIESFEQSSGLLSPPYWLLQHLFHHCLLHSCPLLLSMKADVNCEKNNIQSRFSSKNCIHLVVIVLLPFEPRWI